MKRFPAVLFLLLTTVGVRAQGLEDWYAAVSAAAGIDQNAGRTTLLTLVIPPGGMYQAMGTAYSAVLKDSGYLDANPAGSALLKETELSIYHHDWIGTSRIETVVFTIRPKLNLWGISDVGVGFGGKLLYLPFDAVDTWGQRYKNSWSQSYATGYYSEFIGSANLSGTVGGDFYNHGLTFGASAKLAGRSVPEAIARNQSALTLVTDFGALTKFNLLKFYPSRERNVAVSAVLKNFGFPVNGDPLPTSIVLGLAYSPFRPLTVAFDFTQPTPVGTQFTWANPLGLFQGAVAEEREYALGANLALTTFFALQAGLDYKPGRPRLTAGTTISLEKLTLNMSYAVDLVTTAAVPDRLAVEVKLNLGDLGRKEAEDRARELYLDGVKAYAQGGLDQAILLWEKALSIDPTFVPARNMMDVARATLKNQQDLAEAQKLD